MKKRDLHVVVGVPSGADWSADFGMSLAVMMSYAAQVQLGFDVRTQQVQVVNVKGSILPQLRENVVLTARKLKADYLLFIDSDMVFPRDTLHQLISHNQLVVAANCPTKKIPSTPTARTLSEEVVGGDPVYSTGRAGLQRVWRVGTGVMLIKLSIFNAMPQPWFGIRWDEGREEYVGEDWAFCDNISKRNVPIFVDHKLSQQIGHVGQLMFQHEHILMPEEVERVRAAVVNG